MASVNEEILFDDMNVKITTLRLIFKSETIPIDKIDKIDFEMKVVNLVMAAIFILVFLPSPMFLGNLGYLLISLLFCWGIWAYLNYSVLWITANGKKLKVLSTNIGNSHYIHKVADKLQTAISMSKVLQQQGEFEYTETMKFHQKMKEFDRV